MVNKKILPLAAMEKLMKKASPDIRVSDSAKEELRIVLEDYALKVSKEASDAAVHTGRKTIKSQDIRFVIQKQ